MSNDAPSRSWRWIALVTVIVNAGFNYTSDRMNQSLPSIAEVSARYESLFTPAPYAFAIWGLIYLGLTGYAIFALRDSQRKLAVHDWLAKGLVCYAGLGVAWAEIFRRDALGPSVTVILAMFAVGAMMFGIAKQAVWNGHFRAMVAAPFALFFGWISVAALANLAVWTESRGVIVTPEGRANFAVVMIGIAVALAIIVSRWYRDSIYPLVVIWASLAIWVAQRGENSLVANGALGGAVLTLLWVFANAVWVRRHPTPRAPSLYDQSGGNRVGISTLRSGGVLRDGEVSPKQ